MGEKEQKGTGSSSSSGGAKNSLKHIVGELCAPGAGPVRHIKGTACEQPLPARKMIIEVVDALRSILFPGYFGDSELSWSSMEFHIGSALDWAQRALTEQIRRGLCFTCEEGGQHPQCENRAHAMTWAFIEKLPYLRRMLATDVQAAYEGDPAATSPDEAIFCYPGIEAITCFRIAHELYHLEVPLIPRIITEHAHSITGIDIHPGAEIGESFFIDHGTGVVIGETCVIGNSVRIYQGVTLGAKSFPLDKDGKPIKGIPRHPVVEDEVIIYSEATILGRVTIGRGAVIGGNVWLTRSIPPYSRVSQAQAREERYESGGGI